MFLTQFSFSFFLNFFLVVVVVYVDNFEMHIL